MTRNLIDILINASWRGGRAIGGASGDLRKLSNNATKTSLQMAVAQQKATMLNTAFNTLAKEVALGNMSLEEANELYKDAVEFMGDIEVEAPKAEAGFRGIGLSVGLMSAAVAGGILLFRQFWGAVKEGAEIERARQRLDRLTASIGTTADELVDRLQVASRNTLSEVEALAFGTDLLANGLVDSADKAERLTVIAERLNIPLDVLLLTLGKRSTEKLRGFGIEIDTLWARVHQLEAAGYALDDAFELAFIEGAEDAIIAVGDTALDTIDRLSQLETRWEEFVTGIKAGALELFGILTERTSSVEKAVDEAGIAVDEFLTNMSDTDKEQAAMSALLDVFQVVGDNQRLINTEEFYNIVLNTAAALLAGGKNLRDYGFEATDAGFALKGFVLESDELLLRQRAFEAGRADQAFYNYAEAIETAGEKTRSLYDDTGKLLPEIQALVDKANEFAIPDILGTTIGTTFIKSMDDLAVVMGRSIQDMMDEATGPRTDIWIDFQADLTDITGRESERRAKIEGNYEERRTDIVDQYGEKRAQKEEQLARNINRIREDSTERQAQIRADGNQRLSDLERDHLDRMQEIRENADLQLQEAAGKLDAPAVAKIQRQRKDALGDETDAFVKQRKDIKRQIDERLKADQEAADKRVKREEENSELRLKQMEDAFHEQLTTLKDKHDDELKEIRDNATEARILREDQYIQEKMQLDDHWRAKSDLDVYWMNTILRQEEAFWESRLGLVGGGDADLVDPIEDPTGGGGGDEGSRPSRMWLEQTAVRVAAENKGGDIFAWSQLFKTMTDADLAAWIEKWSEIDVPGYALGGRVPRDLLALVGERGPELVKLPGGSEVMSPSLTSQFFGKATGVNIGELNININEAERPGDTAKEVREEFEKILRELT